MKSGTPRSRLLLIDDHPGVLESIERLLGHRFDVVGVVADSRKAISVANDLSPDIIVLDICMPEPNGIRIAHALRQSGCNAKVIFLTVQEDQDYIDAAMRTGAQGYVLKRRMQPDLLDAIDLVLAGKRFIR